MIKHTGLREFLKKMWDKYVYIVTSVQAKLLTFMKNYQAKVQVGEEEGEIETERERQEEEKKNKG